MQAEDNVKKTENTTPKLVAVVVGVLHRQKDDCVQVLLTSRPKGKSHAGNWEFPGGKVECGETNWQALCRELQEEIGVKIDASIEQIEPMPFAIQTMNYPEIAVQLHFFKIHHWQGDLYMAESQMHHWHTLGSPLLVSPALPSTLPILLQLEADILL